MKIYAISGLGADQRVFLHLKLDHEIIPLNWITPLRNEKIQAYAKRLANTIDTSDSFCLLGVSFGGLIASEMNQFLNPKHLFLISSASTKYELPTVYRYIGKLNFIRYLPSLFFKPPPLLMHWFFEAENKSFLTQILKDTDAYFAKWAINALTTWRNTNYKTNTKQIHGSKDRLIPLKKTKQVTVVNKGTHFMIVDRAAEVSEWINNHLATINNVQHEK